MNRFFLLDCNNFFVSCERVFNARLRNKPVVVLSSGDACIIARSNESKALGIPMGGALFEYEKILKQHNAHIYSANFSLYNDMSNRVMQIVTQLATDIEVYSIDEAFFFVSDYNFPISYDARFYYTAYGHHIRKLIMQQTGLPVSIGVGTTKTLAKIANRFAKKNNVYEGVFDISARSDVDELLAQVPIEDVWGIGYRYAKMLQNKNIKTAYDFKNLDDAWVRKQMTISGLKTLHELRGISCLSLDDHNDSKQSICVSRLFGYKTSNINSIKQALAAYMSAAASKLRAQNSRALGVTVFLITSRHHDPHNYFKSKSSQLSIATDFTPTLIAAAHECLTTLFEPGLMYKKVGVLLTELVSSDAVQLSTYASCPDIEKHTKLMHTLDDANDRWGRDTLFFASVGIKQHWRMRQTRKSPCYTTCWQELLTIDV